MNFIARFFEQLLKRGMGVAKSAIDEPSPYELALCSTTPGSTHPHYYGRVNLNSGRVNQCLRCGFRRVGK